MTGSTSPYSGTEDEHDEVNRIELDLPSQPALLFLARMTAAAVASCANFGYDQVEDLRLALDELCLTVLQGRTVEERLHLQFTWTDSEIEVLAAIDAVETASPSIGKDPIPAVPTQNEFSERILDALVDDHGSSHRDGTLHSWLRMDRKNDGSE